MRTTKNLIEELRTEALSAELVMLAVGFPAETKMVSSSLTDPEALNLLNSLVQQGGHPLGFIRSRKVGKRRYFDSRALSEYADNPVPGRVLRDICERAGDDLERRFGVYTQRLS